MIPMPACVTLRTLDTLNHSVWCPQCEPTAGLSRRSSASSVAGDDALPEDASTDTLPPTDNPPISDSPTASPFPAARAPDASPEPGTLDVDVSELKDPGDTEEAPTVGELVGAVNVGETCTAVVGDNEVGAPEKTFVRVCVPGMEGYFRSIITRD